MLVNLLFASLGYVAIRIVIAPVRIKLLTSLLSKEDYALLTLAMLTVSFVTLISSLGSLEFMLRKIPGRDRGFQFSTLRTIMSFFGLLGIVIAALGGLALMVWTPARFPLGRSDAVALGLILVLTVHLTQLVYFLMGRSEYAHSRMLMLLYADAWFLPLLVFMGRIRISISFILWLWVIWLFLSMAVSQSLVSLREVFQRSSPRARLRPILAFGVPLLPMIMGEWIFQVQDRYVLLAFTNLDALANYTLCFNIAWVGVGTGTSLLDVLVTEFYKARNLSGSRTLAELRAYPPLRKSFTLMLRYGLILAVPIVLALWIARTPIVLLLSDPKFADAAELMKWVAPLPLCYILVIISGRTLMALDRGMLVGASTLAAAGVHLTLSVVLAPRLGERGVALAGCAAYTLLAIHLGMQARIVRWIDWSELRPIRLGVFFLVTAAGLICAVRYVAGHHFWILASGGAISLAALLLLGLVRKSDVDHLLRSVQSPSEPEEAALQEPFARD
ncbi:MAG: lipopolysaccharide biosynthesis protein [Kiritimatiellae bacterium]|nr:lipopolysaccharide biosynthesis protein [Kiritimatiellia bacterium]